MNATGGMSPFRCGEALEAGLVVNMTASEGGDQNEVSKNSFIPNFI